MAALLEKETTSRSQETNQLSLPHYSLEELTRRVAALRTRLEVFNSVWRVHISNTQPKLEAAKTAYSLYADLLVHEHDIAFQIKQAQRLGSVVPTRAEAAQIRAQQIYETDLAVAQSFANRDKLHELIESEQGELLELEFKRLRIGL